MNPCSLRRECVCANDEMQVREAQGSRYCSAPIKKLLGGEMACSRAGIAVVGLPCHFHGLWNWEHVQKRLAGTVIVKIDLVCDRVLSSLAIEHLIRDARVARRDVAASEYRSKEWRGRPGDASVRTQAGEVRCLSCDHRLRMKDIYTPPVCRLCFDKMHVLADIVMDNAYGVPNGGPLRRRKKEVSRSR
jgi:coenzyme F420 hydrogenase subunit beta